MDRYIHLLACARPHDRLVLRAGYGMPHLALHELYGELVGAGKLPPGIRYFTHLATSERPATLVLPPATDLYGVLRVLNDAAFQKWSEAGRWPSVVVGCLTEDVYDSVLAAADRH